MTVDRHRLLSDLWSVLPLATPAFASRTRSCPAARWAMRQHGQATQVLSGCREREFIVRTTESAQPQAGDFQNPLLVGEEHLDLLAQATRPRVFRRLPNSSRDLPDRRHSSFVWTHEVCDLRAAE